MTRKSILIVGLLLIALLPMQAARKLTKISFDKLTHDFGTLYEKDGNATAPSASSTKGRTPLVIRPARKHRAAARYPPTPNTPSLRATRPR